MVRRRLLLTVIGGSAIALLPWIWYLAATLPARHDADQWRVAWVGFDAGLVALFALGCWLSWRRHRVAVPVLAATATMLFCDAWFDILLDWTAPDRGLSVLTAVAAELPLAAVLLMRARDLLVGGSPRHRPLTPGDIAIHEDPEHQAVLNRLSEAGPADVRTLADALARTPADLAGTLATLARAGYVTRDRRGRWATKALDLRMPQGGDPWARAYLDRKFDREARLLAGAARNHAVMGPWGKGERSAVRLTAGELARFNDEYRELLARYSLLHPRPGRNTRTVLVRFYAFPRELAEPVPAAG